MKNDLRRLLASLGDLPLAPDRPRSGDRSAPRDTGDNSADRQDLDALLAAQRALAQQHVFKPGDLVRWKRTPQGLSLSNRKRPLGNELAVVVGVLDSPVLLQDEDVDSGHPTWREPLNLQLGLLDDDGDFLVFHFDAARFEPVPAQAARSQAARQLRERQTALACTPTLAPGMLVRWKPGLKNRKWPAAGQAAVVLQVLDEPCHDPKKGAGTHYFREPLDVVLGVLIEGELLAMHADARRFKVIEESAHDTEGMPPH